MEQKNVPVSLKSLPKELAPFHSMAQIRDPDITEAEKVNLVRAYGPKSKEWLPPKTAKTKEFALDMILY